MDAISASGISEVQISGHGRVPLQKSHGFDACIARKPADLPGNMLGFGFDPKIMPSIIGATSRHAGVFSLQQRRPARNRSLSHLPLQGIECRERRPAFNPVQT